MLIRQKNQSHILRWSVINNMNSCPNLAKNCIITVVPCFWACLQREGSPGFSAPGHTRNLWGTSTIFLGSYIEQAPSETKPPSGVNDEVNCRNTVGRGDSDGSVLKTCLLRLEKCNKFAFSMKMCVLRSHCIKYLSKESRDLQRILQEIT